MLSGDEAGSNGGGTKPVAKSGTRKRKDGKRAEPRRRKSTPPPDLQPDQAQEAPPAQTMSAPQPSGPDLPADTAPAVASAVVPEVRAVSLQTIANAYGDYSRRSLDQARSFFEQLAGVRSLDKAIALQTEFARQACESFIAESRRIRELHNELARQRLKSWEDIIGRFVVSR